MAVSQKFSNPKHNAIALVAKGGKDYRVIDDREYFYIIDAEGYELANNIFTSVARAVDFILTKDIAYETWTGTPYSKD